MTKYVVVYGRFSEDKESGVLLTGIYLGGVVDTREEADELATRSVAEVQGGLIIPKVAPLSDNGFLATIDDLVTRLDQMAERMYENEKLLP